MNAGRLEHAPAFLAVSAAALAACSHTVPDGENASTLTFEGARYEKVAGEELRSTILGHFLLYRPSPEIITSPRCDRFHDDGRTYEACGDRVPRIPGTFEIRRDRVCARTFGGTERCRLLFRSEGHRYVVRDAADGRIQSVCVRPLRDDSSPCAWESR